MRKKISGSVDKKTNVNTDLLPEKTSSPKTAHQKATFGEKTARDKMVNDGYQPLGNTNGTYKPGETGINGAYKHPNPPPDYVITEDKYNTEKLENTADRKQMSDGWITESNRLEKAGLSTN